MGTVSQQTKNNALQIFIKKQPLKQQKLHLTKSCKQLSIVGISWNDVLCYQDWSQLRSLTIDQCGLNAKNVHIISNLNWPCLQYLDVRRNQLKVQGVQELIRNQWPNLEQLDIRQNSIKDSGMEKLLEKQLKLKILILIANRITQKGLRSMPDYHSNCLLTLNLSYNKIGVKGIQLLIKANIPNLRNLLLDNCHIGNEGVRNLVKNIWVQFRELNIRDNKIGFGGYSALALSSWRQFSGLSFTNFEAITMLFLTTTLWANGFFIDWDIGYKKWEKDILKIHQKLFIQD